jgi:hypothetical protein
MVFMAIKPANGNWHGRRRIIISSRRSSPPVYSAHQHSLAEAGAPAPPATVSATFVKEPF